MEIIVSGKGFKENFQYDDGSVTIEQLTKDFAERTKIRRNALKLRFAGKLLDDTTATLSSYDIRSGCNINCSTRKLPGFDSLGPFGIVPNLEKMFNIQVLLKDSNGEMTCSSECLKKFSSITGLNDSILVCLVSPKHKVTLSDEMRVEAKIPLGDNVYFCWMYPFLKVENCTEDGIKALDASDPFISLILYGGYLYLDQNDVMIQVNGIKQGPGLYFDGPFHMNQLCFDEIQKNGRFQPTTIKLEDCESFCWFLPSEEKSIKSIIGVPPFTDDDGNEVPIPHGAFGYECPKNNHRMFLVTDKVPPTSGAGIEEDFEKRDDLLRAGSTKSEGSSTETQGSHDSNHGSPRKRSKKCVLL